MAEPRFEVYKDVAGKFRFRLKAANNKIIAVSEGYETRAGCIKGVEAVKRYSNAPMEDLTRERKVGGKERYEVYKDMVGKFRFRLRTPNNKIIAVSDGYKTKEECLEGVKAVEDNFLAYIEDLTADETTLILEPPPNEVDDGMTITFRGRLVNEHTGKGVPRVKVSIYERDRSFMLDDFMSSGITGSDGTFAIEWKAKKMDWWDDTVETYVAFAGSGSNKPSKTKSYTIAVVG